MGVTMANPYLYPLDLTGKAPSNRVTGEKQTISAPSGAFDFHFIIPRSGPYYRDTLVIRHIETNKILVRGTDWEPGHWFKSASYETENAEGGIYQSILFTDRTLSGSVELITYNVLGDEWSLDEAKILEILSNKVVDPRSILYEQVNGKPEVFPPMGHPHPADDLIGMREQVEATYQVADALRERTEQLPSQLRLALENYYNRSEVDQLLVTLSESLINGILGPEIESMLEAVIAQMIGGYYTKGQVDTMINALQNAISALYTNKQIDDKLLAKVDKTTYAQDIAMLATREELSTVIGSIVQGSVSSSDLDALNRALTAVDNRQQLEINTLRQSIAGIGGNMDEYIKKDELLELVPPILFEPDIFPPASVTTEDSDKFVVNVVSVSVVEGKIRTAELMVASGASVNIVPVMEPGGIPKSYPVPSKLVEYDATEGWEAEGYSSATEMWNAIKGGLVGFAIRFTVNDYKNTSGDHVQEYIFDCENTLVAETGLTPTGVFNIRNKSLSPTTSTECLVALVKPKGAGAEVITYSNTLLRERLEVKTVELTKAQALTTTPIVLEFSYDQGHDYITTVRSVKMLDPNGVLLGIASYYHEHVRAFKNTVTVFKPAIDLASFGATDKLTIEVAVHTRTLR